MGPTDELARLPAGRPAPGIVGFGLTEGPGGVERFEVEVLARQEGYGLGFPLILVRASGPAIDAGGGVSAGMSGSPVLLPHGDGDALLGAIAYTFPDSPGQLALVTPIAAMRDQAGVAAATRPGARARGGRCCGRRPRARFPSRRPSSSPGWANARWRSCRTNC
jgi:hypothetical protein